MKSIKWLCCCLLLLAGRSTYAQQEGYQLREGVHNLTLQWVGWDHPGKVQIHKKGAVYTVKGEQRGKDNVGFVTIDGTLKVVSAKELLFEGTIQTMDSTINQGKVCEKKGTYHFVSKGTRKYWRLQEMNSCEGNNVVDYVDIYF
jgi:hypothetical protein